MQINNSPICEEKSESMKHLLTECDSLARKHMRLLGIGYPIPEDYRQLPVGNAVKFIGSIFQTQEQRYEEGTIDPVGRRVLSY